MGSALRPPGTPGAGPAPAALPPPGLTNLPNSGIAPWDPGLGKPSTLIASAPALQCRAQRHKSWGPAHPKTKGPRQDLLLGHPLTPDSPLPQLPGFECKQSGGAGSVASLAGGRPLSAQYPALEGRGARHTFTPPSSVPPTHPQPSLCPLPKARAGPHGALRESASTAMPPPPASLRARKQEQPVGWGQEERGAQAVRPPTLAHREQPGANGASAAVGRALPSGAGRPGSGQELGFPGQPASPAERSGGRGAAAGKSDPTTSASVQARPKLSVGGGGAGGSSEAWERGSWPPTRQHRGPPLRVAPLS